MSKHIRSRCWTRSSLDSGVAVALGVALALAGLGAPGLADDTTIPTTSSIVNPYTSLSAPQFAISSAQSLSNLYGSCFAIGAGATGSDSLTQALSQLMTGSGSGGASCGSLNTQSCTPIVPSGSPSCTDNSDGTFDDTAFKKLIATAQQNQCCANAKVSTLQKANQELGCISSQDQALQTQIQSMASSIQQNLQTAQTNVSSIDQTVSDRVNQTSFLNGKLQGDKNSPGLLALQQQMSTVVPNTMPTQEQALETAANQWEKDTQILPEKIQARRMALAGQCFTQTLQVKCSLTSASDCSYEQYVIAEYYQDVRSNNGVIDTSGDVGSPTGQGIAQGSAGGLQAALTNIFTQVPTQVDISFTPATQAEGQAEAQAQAQENEGPLQILTPAQFDSLVTQDLGSFNTSAFSVTQFVQNAFNQCYNNVLSQNDQETTDAVDELNEEQNKVSQSANNFLTQYSQIYTQLWDAFGDTASMNLSQCQNTSEAAISTRAGQVTGTNIPVTQELQCARDVMADIQGMWQGTSASSQVNVSVPASNQSNAFSFTCYGINGCVTSMKNAVQNLTAATQSLDQYKKQYIQQVNQSLDNMKTQVQGMLSGQSMMLQQQLNQLKTTLSNAGVTAPLTFPPIAPQSFTQGTTTDSTGQSEPGLYQNPSSAQLLGIFGGGLNPPLPDPTQNSFENAQAQVSQTMQQDQQQAQQISSSVQDLQQQEQKCEQTASKGLTTTAENALQVYITSCVQNQPCPTSGSSALSNFQSLVDSLNPGAAQTSLDGILTSGQASSCGGGGAMALANKKLQSTCTLAATAGCSQAMLTAESCLPASIPNAPQTSSDAQQKNCNASGLLPILAQAQNNATPSPLTTSGANCGMLNTNAANAITAVQNSQSDGDSSNSAQ